MDEKGEMIMSYNLNNLNDYEFELLCKDIMECKLDKKLYTFPRGKDQGIDICDSKRSPEIIIQVKHYIKSKYSDLIRTLKGEVEKINKLAPKEYYICCSIELNKNQKDEIHDIFKSYMKDRANIIDAIEINDILSSGEGSEIVKKHYKLWLCSSEMLTLLYNKHTFFDCDELVGDIEENSNLFVPTKAYFDSLKLLKEQGIVIITGAPGVGKSMISKMLIFYYVSQGYHVRYSSDNNISDIKNILSEDEGKKEIILMDDFLGQHYLKLNEKQPNEMKTLLSYITRRKNKKIILNSRITILNEAKQSSIVFKKIMDDNETSQYLIDLDRMSNLEKARIFYNHIYFNALPLEYFNEVKAEKNYIRIIKHKNYNPRIIEYVTRKVNYEEVLSSKYVEFVFSKLDNPKDVWADEFRNRLEEVDRIMMNTLYSLTNTVVKKTYLEKAFNKRVRNCKHIDSSINVFDDVIFRLTKSLIKNTYDRGILNIGVINPSVNDYIHFTIFNNINERISIIENAEYIEQLFKVATDEDTKQLLINFVRNGELLKLSTLQNNKYFYFVKLVVEYSIFDTSIENNLRNCICNMFDKITSGESCGELIMKLFNDFCEFYKLDNLFLDEKLIEKIIRPLNYRWTIKIANAFAKKYDEKLPLECIVLFKEKLINELEDEAVSNAEDELSWLIDNNIEDYVRHGEIDELGLQLTLEDEIQDYISNYLFDELKSIADLYGIVMGDFDEETLSSYVDYDSQIDSAIEERYMDYDEDAYRYEQGDNSDDEIIEMFER